MSNPKHPGRPSGYNPEYHPQEMYKLMCQGAKDTQLGVAFDISMDTFYRWIKQYPDFKIAHDKGLPHCENWWENKGIEFMEQGNAKAYNYWKTFMVKKFGPSWGNNHADTNIQINQFNLANEQKTPQELIDMIKANLNYLKETDVLDLDESQYETSYEQIEFREQDPIRVVGNSTDADTPSE